MAASALVWPRQKTSVLTRSELGAEPYRLQAALIAPSRHKDRVVKPITTQYKLGKTGECKLVSPNVHTLTLSCSSTRQIPGIGNLSMLAELQVPWAPYVGPKCENSVGERGLEVPLDGELPPSARP